MSPHSTLLSATWPELSFCSGACGTTSGPSDFVRVVLLCLFALSLTYRIQIVALNSAVSWPATWLGLWSLPVQEYEGGAHCFEMITITVNGKTAQAQIIDEASLLLCQAKLTQIICR